MRESENSSDAGSLNSDAAFSDIWIAANHSRNVAFRLMVVKAWRKAWRRVARAGFVPPARSVRGGQEANAYAPIVKAGHS